MALQIIGAGFGRTGTLAAKLALEKLGIGRCYHMMEVFGRPEHVALWHDAAHGKRVDWDALFAGFDATVDWPACSFWRELSEHYPDAKVLLTVRDAERWYESVHNTIYQAMTHAIPEGAPPHARMHRDMVLKLVLDSTFGGRFEDRAHAIAVFERHNEAVRRAIAPERLLVYEVAEGWEPLCRFVGRPVPDEPFPRINTTEEFRNAFMLNAK
jgi:Sulfotransferase domain